MLKSPKTVAGRIARKIAALLTAYCFLATCMWSLNPPGIRLGDGTPVGRVSWRAVRNPFDSLVSAAAGSSSSLSGSVHGAARKAFTNLAGLNAATAMVQGTGGATATTNFFGPQQYVRTTGDPNTYTTTIQVPAWVTSPFNLHIQSGEADGSHRVSSATVSINNTPVAVSTDFNQNVFTLDRSVTLTPQTTLTVTLASKPGSYLRINLAGTSEDHTAPTITIVAPVPNSAINTTTPRFDIKYQDLLGTGEPAASGLNLSTLQISIDDVDRTSLFTKRADEATAVLPASLALTPGSHRVAATIQDNAGNPGQASGSFLVDTTSPSLQIVQPADGVVLNTATPQIQLAYGDNVAVDTSSLKVIINNKDQTALFTKTTQGATAFLDSSTALPNGANAIVATVNDTAGNSATATSHFTVDTIKPVITILHPADGSRHGTTALDILIQYQDDDLDVGSLKVLVDNNPVPVTANPTQATGSINALDGTHNVFASINDKAGNQGSATSSFVVDTTKPNIHIVQPAPAANINTPSPQIQVQYGDPVNNIDTSFFKFSIDGVDQSSRFTVTTSGATATAPVLADGSHTLFAQIANGLGTLNSATNPLVVDTVKPTISVLSPLGAINTANASASIQYSDPDPGSGIDIGSIQITLDQADVTSLFTRGATLATGTLPTLSEGRHSLQASVADKATNPASTDAPSFLVDLTPPTASFDTPADNSFTNQTQPSITLKYADSLSGIDSNSIHIFLQQGSNAEAEITSLFTVGPTQATGTIPNSSPLAPGTYQLRATVSDLAGNNTPATSTFVVDTSPPVCTIDIPAANLYFNTATPVIQVSCQDDSGAIDRTRLTVSVDNVDVTSQLTVTGSGATGTLSALADGAHTIQVSAFDRAGNPAPPVQALFTVDTTKPAISITSPPDSSVINNSQPPITVVFSDTGTGIDVTTFSLTIDNTDHTADFTVSLTGANGSAVAALPDGAHVIVAGISDLAGNRNTATSNFTVKTAQPPQISITSPADGFLTNATSIAVSGTVTASSAVTVSVEGTSVPVSNNAFTTTVALGAGPSQDIHATATDVAGLSSSTKVTVNIDRVPPTITAQILPQPNGAQWNNTDVTVTFNCSDDSGVIATCTGSVPVTDEGRQIVSGNATDQAGNPAVPLRVPVNIDKTPPTVSLSTPDQITPLHPGQISVTASDNLSGVAQVVISVNGTTLATLTGPSYQTNLAVPAGANPGDTLTVTAVAFDQAGNSASAAPHGVRVAADQGVIVGQVLDDTSGLPIEKASVQIISSPGSVDYTDDRGRYSLQAQGSHLFLSISGPAPTPSTTPPPPPTTTAVEREVFVQQGAGTVPVDARLTPLAKQVSVGSAGGTLSAGPLSISVLPFAVPDGTIFQLTPLSGQGLPGLLPLGWSPLASFDLRSSASPTNLSGAITQFPNLVAYLVTYNPALHAWTLLDAGDQPVNGTVNFTVPSTGVYSLVVPDNTNPPISIPAASSPLTGLDVLALDPAAVSSGSLNPAILPAGGGTSTATLGIQSPSFMPSGTVIQANVSEKFSLASGDLVSEQTRSEDIVLYTALAPANASLGATFPVTPSHTYSNAQLLTGKVHLDILAGREGVRGTPGGSDPVTVTDETGTTTLSVPGAALIQDTAISVQSVALEDFVPTSTSMSALPQEVLVDFSGEILNTPAQLSIPSTGLDHTHTFLLTQVQRISGVPHMVAVAVAQINGSNLTSVASPGLPGVTQGGEYVFYDIGLPAGFVQGVAATAAGAVPALVQTDSLQIVSITGTDGRYIIPALAGTVNLRANGTTSSVAGTASAQLSAGQLITADIQLNGVVNTATVSPADSSLGVSTSIIITITSPVPIDPATAVSGNVALFQGTRTNPGPQIQLLSPVLSLSGTVLTLTPVQNLDPATQYTLQVSGLADKGQGAIVVPISSFTTKANQPLTFDPNAITFGFPDQNGNIHVSAPAGSLPKGTKVLIIDQSNAVVLSLTAFDDGSLSGDFPGTINDILQVTATDPNGASATFTRSQFVAADGSVAVGPGGGTVTGPGGVAMIIPAGALDKGATFKIEAFGPDAFPERPDVPGGNFGGGLKISSPDNPTFKKEAKVAFPMPPDAPPGAFFQVYSRLQTPDNSHVTFADVDYALPQGQGVTAQVVTASFPYRGLIDLNMLIAQADFNGQAIDTAFSVPPVAQLGEQAVMYLIWTANDILPGIALGGTVTGRVRYAVPPGGAMPDGTINKTGDTAFVGVLNALVKVDDNPPSHAVLNGATGARTQPDGSFTFSDPRYNGGTVNLIVYDGNGNAVTASAIEVVSLTDKTVNDYAGPLLKFYRNVAFANIVVPAPAPPPPTPQIGINFFKEDPNSNPPGLRVPLNGIITAGTSLVIAFKTNGQVANQPTVTINGTPYASQPDQPTITGDPNTLDFELSQPFVPSTPGIYTITATGLTAFAQPITASKSFMVIAAGGSNNDIKVGVPPRIASVVPAAGAGGVLVDTFIQVFFSEPVTNLAGNVSLVPADGSAPPPIKLSGFSYLDVANTKPIPNLSATDAVSSVTIQPLTGLKFNTKYTLKVTTDVVDLDNVSDPSKPALHFVPPEALDPPEAPWDFTTFGPQVLGGTTAFGSTRPVVMGNRVYVAIPSLLTMIKTFDISDPSNPTEIPTSTNSFIGRGFDLAGEENAQVIGGGNLLAAVSGFYSEAQTVPSNLWLYNVSGDQVNRVGAVSVTSSVDVGQGTRVALDGNFAYVYVNPVGIEVVDLQQAINDYNTTFGTNPTQFGVAVSTGGQGFANDAVVNTIPVKDSALRNVIMQGIQAAEFLVPSSDPQNPTTQTFVVATGAAPASTSTSPISFVVADPTQPGPSAVVYSGQPQLGSSKLTNGVAVVLGQLTDSVPDASGNPVVTPVAVVVGYGTAPDPANPAQTTSGVLAVLDMTTPSSPVVLGMIGLPANPTDVVLKDTTALVGTSLNKVLLVNLVDPRNPVNAGVISEPGSVFGDRLAITGDGILVGTSMNGTNGGIHTATLGPIISITGTQPAVIYVDKSGHVMQDFAIKYQALDPGKQLTNGTATVVAEDQTAYEVPISDFSPGEHTISVPAGTKLKVPPQNLVVTVQKPDGTFTDPVSMIITGDFDAQVTALQPGASGTTGGTGGNPLPFASSVITLSPDVIPVNSPDTVIQVSGQGLTGLKVIFVRQQDGPWISETLTVTSDSQGAFTLPAALASAIGVVAVSFSQSDASAAPLFVADPRLPSPSSVNVLSATIGNAVATAIGVPNLAVDGNNFPADMQIAVGAQDAPAFTLPVISRTTTTIIADSSTLPISVLSSLTVYGVSGDNTLITVGQPVGYFDERAIEVGSPADSPDDADFFSTNNPLTTVNPADTVPLGDVALVSVAGDLHAIDGSNTSDTFDLTLTGVNLTSGMMVQVVSPRGDDAPVLAQVALQNVTQIPDSTFLSPDYIAPTQSTAGTGGTSSGTAPPNTVATGKVSVPSNVKKTPSTQAKVKAKTKTGQTVAAAKKINVEKFFTSVPAGGRIQLVLYKDKDGNLSIHVPQIDRQAPTDAQPVPGEQVQLSVPGNDPLLRVTQESESVQGTPGPAGSKLLYLRGQHLTLNVPDAHGVASVRTMDPNDPSSALRPWATVVMSTGGQATSDCSNTKITACRNFDVGFESLGPLLQNIDKMIVEASDLVTPLGSAVVPPQFLKSQFMQETSLGATNFRYEALTFDFADLSGDLRSLPYETDLFHSYETAGNVVQRLSQTPEQFDPTQSITGQPLKFQLSHAQVRLNALQPFHISDPYEPCVRLNGGTPSMRDCGVHVTLQEVYQNRTPVPHKRSVEFAPVRSDTIWRHSTRTRGNIAGVTPQGNQYSIDQNSGIITLGRQPQTFTEPNPDPTDTKNPTVPTFELMTVTYGTFNSTPRTCAGQPCQDGTMVSKVLDLNQGLANGKVRPSGVKLNYSPRQSLCAFYNSNMPKIMSVLAMTISEDNLEFLPPVGPTGQYQVRDQRYCGAISQPYPASTYGIGQMSLELWSSNSAFAKWFDAVGTPITDLLDNTLASAELTVQAHLLKERGSNKCDAAHDNPGFQQCWSNAFIQYNNNGAGYANDPNVATGGLAPIVWRGAQCFEPKQSYGTTFSTNLYCTNKNFTIHRPK